MKKNAFIFLFFLMSSTQVHAFSEMEISGELDLTASVWSLPTGERGKSSFNIPTLFLDIEAPLEGDNLMTLRLEGIEKSDQTDKRFSVGVREAYLDLLSVFEEMRALRLGLIPQVWQEAQYQEENYRFLGQSAWNITEKWKYLSYSDMGLSYMSQFDFGEWAFSLVNGEGVEVEENGPHKEASLFVRFVGGASWGLSLGYVRGHYDTYGADLGLKERSLVLLTYQNESRLSVGLEYLAAKDPADALASLSMADAVDVTDLTGQAVQGQGGSFYVVIPAGEKTDILLRYDYLNPVMAEKKKDLQMAILALSYQLNEQIKVGASVDYTRYGENFAPGARDRSKVDLVSQVLF